MLGWFWGGCEWVDVLVILWSSDLPPSCMVVKPRPPTTWRLCRMNEGSAIKYYYNPYYILGYFNYYEYDCTLEYECVFVCGCVVLWLLLCAHSPFAINCAFIINILSWRSFPSLHIFPRPIPCRVYLYLVYRNGQRSNEEQTNKQPHSQFLWLIRVWTPPSDAPD